MTYAERPINDRAMDFYKYTGPINSPEKYTEFCIHMGRQSGKTTTLIDSLPCLAPAAVLCWNDKAARELESRFKRQFPDFDGKVIFCSWRSVDTRLRGHSVDIYYDNGVQDMILLQATKDINEQYGKRRFAK